MKVWRVLEIQGGKHVSLAVKEAHNLASSAVVHHQEICLSSSKTIEAQLKQTNTKEGQPAGTSSEQFFS